MLLADIARRLAASMREDAGGRTSARTRARDVREPFAADLGAPLVSGSRKAKAKAKTKTRPAQRKAAKARGKTKPKPTPKRKAR